MLFSELARIVNEDAHVVQDGDITTFSTDSRTLFGRKGEAFVAIKAQRDGHDFAMDAWKRGVRYFILEKELPLPESNTLIVSNTLRALQHIARFYRQSFQIPVIGITGSNGKTTVKEWLSTILSEKYFVVKSPKSYNSQIGVPLSVLEMRQNHELGIFEAGISKVGEMQSVAHVIAPTFGIFTNLGEAHNDGFSSKKEKLSEKLQLFESSKKVVCRSDTPYFKQIEEALGEKIISWSKETQADYQVKWGVHSIQVQDFEFKINFEGYPHQLENLTHCVVAAIELGLSPMQIQQGIDQIQGVPMRLELKKGVNGCYLLDDTYNNDELGLKVAIEYLESQKQNEQRTLILSDILHAGKPGEMLYGQIADLLRAKNIRLVGVGTGISSVAHLFGENDLFFDTTEDLIEHLPLFQNEMILIKGARNFALERVVKLLEEKNHGTVLEVNFEALRHNLNAYQALLKKQTRLMVMVKANAYGSGILEVSNFLQHQQVDLLGVAYLDEAIELRKHGITIPIMIMNPYIESFEQFERFDLQAEIFSLSHFKRMIRDTQRHPKIHLKIDTGMHRLGFGLDELPTLIKTLQENPNVEVAGIFTHFSSADDPSEDDFTNKQAAIFEQAFQLLCDALGYEPVRHACNSSGIARWPQYHYEMVRLGIGLHGFDPTQKLALRHTSQLKTIISQIQELEAGATVGYGRKGLLKRASRIAVIPIGYEDGYARVFGNGSAKVSVNGSLCPTIGNVCMDMTMVDVTDVDAKEGDTVIVFGTKPSIKDLASWSGTIPYEILTNVSNRVKRIFISE